MTDDIDKDEERALTAEYILGLLTDDERTAYEEVLAIDPDLRSEYAFFADRMVALTDDIAPVTPPAGLFGAIKADLFGTPKSDRATSKARSWLERLGLFPAMAGGVVAAVAVLWAVNLYVPGAPTGDGPAISAPTLQAQIAAEDDSLIVMASYDATAQTLVLDRTAGTARDGRSLELWLIADDNPPVSLGVLPDTQAGTIAVDPALVPALPGGVLAITDEPQGGSPTGGPTGDVLAAGPLTQT
ncbi:anti-sigma factor [Loktanella sp. SALINAS62]|uniref:anti-sigma factor n=1 Tax=Loktanella sp. SALINAS62 TaxID=2706124 RepID=UPI001B8AD4C3|nr:anti-sigma factor [Loktanella sp. SALINAS62]MBS1303798.1 hypothetical protein [Loktanella sp. SALINAS62]